MTTLMPLKLLSCLSPRILVMIIYAVMGVGCDNFEYNPYQTIVNDNDVRVTTAHNIQLLEALPHKDTLRIVFFGDTQRLYDDVSDLVKSVNQLPEVDAVFITGDISDFGLVREYEIMNRQLKKLKVPFLTVIGNHDCLGNAKELYKKIYGPLDYSFTWNDIRFVMVNTNSREFSFNGQVPDLAWMRDQIKDTALFEATIFVAHIPPYDNDFDPDLEAEYSSIVRDSKNPIANVNGHRHSFSLTQPYSDGIWYLNTSSPVNRIYSLVTVYPYGLSQRKFDNINIAF
jgi:3',5'-cyclic-AMP phosphodiesterase